RWISLNEMKRIEGIWTFNDSIFEDDWNFFGNGTLTLTIKATDIQKNNGTDVITLYKELSHPSIIIHSPIEGSLHGIQAPRYEIELNGKILESFWYVINNSHLTLQSPYYSVNDYVQGQISQAHWNRFGNESIDLTFIVKNKAGTCSNATIRLQKDNILPIITILQPSKDNLIFGEQAPSYKIEVEDWNVHETWYMFNGSLNRYYLTSNEYSGIINQEAWNSYGNATIIITFHSNDTAGNYYQTSITVIKQVFNSSLDDSDPSGGQEGGNNDGSSPPDDTDHPSNSTTPRIPQVLENTNIVLPLTIGLLSTPGLTIISSWYIKKRLGVE
ncbi:MAG: hypothetical protein ACTSU4_11095, partial [Promethearchaeota archaeon]